MQSSEQQMATLPDMGFGNNRAVRALQATGFKVTFTSIGNDYMVSTCRGPRRPWSGFSPGQTTPRSTMTSRRSRDRR